MALTINKGREKNPKHPNYLVKEWLHVNADKTKLVMDPKDPEAAYLLARPGAYLTHEDAVRYGLLNEDGTDPNAPAEAEAEAEPETEPEVKTVVEEVKDNDDDDDRKASEPEVVAENEGKEVEAEKKEVKTKEVEATVTSQKPPHVKAVQPTNQKKIG